MKVDLSKKDSVTYRQIVKMDDMEGMFGFGYICGKIEGTKEALEIFRGKDNANKPK